VACLDGRADAEEGKADDQPHEKEMDSNFHFGPAQSGERTAYGARMPDASLTRYL